MKASIIVHNDTEADSLEFIKIAGIINSLAPDSDVVDANQHFEKDNVLQVAAYLFTTVPFWPEGSVFLSLVGQGRPVAVVLNDGNLILSKDNGTASMCADRIGIREAYILDDSCKESDHQLVKACAALVQGKELKDLGRKASIKDIVLFDIPKAQIAPGRACGQVGMLLKNFGNITFTIRTEDFAKTGIRQDDLLQVTFTFKDRTVYDQQMTYQPSFGYVAEGSPVIFNGSSGYMDIGLNRRSFINECLPELLECADIGEYKVCIQKIGEQQ